MFPASAFWLVACREAQQDGKGSSAEGVSQHALETRGKFTQPHPAWTFSQTNTRSTCVSPFMMLNDDHEASHTFVIFTQPCVALRSWGYIHVSVRQQHRGWYSFSWSHGCCGEHLLKLISPAKLDALRITRSRPFCSLTCHSDKGSFIFETNASSRVDYPRTSVAQRHAPWFLRFEA